MIKSGLASCEANPEGLIFLKAVSPNPPHVYDMLRHGENRKTFWLRTKPIREADFFEGGFPQSSACL
jgi:hypothetical protein